MKTTSEKILLGCGVVSVGGFPLGLTRGGSEFIVEREFRTIEADCDRGPVKGRQVIDASVPKLTVNALEPFASDEIARYYPALSVDSNNAGYDEITDTLTIVAGDYNDVQFAGKTKDGKDVTIQVDNAINLANIEWALEDKAEVVPALEFTGHYEEDSIDTPPYRIRLGKTDSQTVTFTVKIGGSVTADADVTLYGRTIRTDATGKAVFTGIPGGLNHLFSVAKGGHQTYYGSVSVASSPVAQAVTIIPIA